MRTFLFILFSIVCFKAPGQCIEKEFVGPSHKFAYLLRLATDTTHNSRIEQDFFCAYPNSVGELNAIFGADQQTGMLPLNGVHDRLKIIFFFYHLRTIDKSAYYKKYIDLCVDGEWQNTDDVDGFGLLNKLLADPSMVVTELETRTDSDILNVFRLLLSCTNEKGLNTKYTEINEVLARNSPALMAPLHKAYNEIQTSTPWQRD
ncbi:hypothetical protein IMPR6_370046 [Imperialibacter sp. EC-SDR9]|nr:hypothetical protein IMPERIA75_20045 [Imperialibacter sp. 75]CAD5285460.1 hypothetical protein IMPERIA89_520045 [Imperialibacter sp. 89]VVT23327.1 hypothetical protein IMPR6_370046 [Imperialibacter sp. EC-SDR9]